MYTFVSVWLVWIAFIVFIGGLIYRFITLITLAKKDKVIFPYMSLKYSLRSLVHWIIPFASRNMRMRYETTVVTFAFHLCAVLVPIFLTAHVAMIAFSWGVSLANAIRRRCGWIDHRGHSCRCLLPITTMDAPRGEVRDVPVGLLVAARRCSPVCHRIYRTPAVARL